MANPMKAPIKEEGANTICIDLNLPLLCQSRAHRPEGGGGGGEGMQLRICRRDGKMLVVTKNRTKRVGGWQRQLCSLR